MDYLNAATLQMLRTEPAELFDSTVAIVAQEHGTTVKQVLAEFARLPRNVLIDGYGDSLDD